MLYNDHWEELKKYMSGYWAREKMDRCSAAIMVQKPGYKDFGEHNFYFDVETADKMHRARFENTDYLLESMPVLFPYFGTAGICEYTGCKPTRTPRTTWYDPWMAQDDEPDASKITFSCPEAFHKQKDAISRLIELSGGDYLVSVTDNCGIIDALAEIRGTDNLLVDMISDPDFVLEGVRNLLPIYKQTQNELFDLVKDNNDGSVLSWMQLWAPKRMAQMQCDLCVMISNDMFNRFVMPELEELCAFLDYPVYHFDGREQIRHLDSLLSLENLKAIQWTPVSGQPRTSEFIPVLQKIQKSGKNLVLFPHASEVETLLDNLSSRGLHLLINGVSTLQEADDMIALLQKKSKDHMLL